MRYTTTTLLATLCVLSTSLIAMEDGSSGYQYCSHEATPSVDSDAPVSENSPTAGGGKAKINTT